MFFRGSVIKCDPCVNVQMWPIYLLRMCLSANGTHILVTCVLLIIKLNFLGLCQVVPSDQTRELDIEWLTILKLTMINFHEICKLCCFDVLKVIFPQRLTGGGLARICIPLYLLKEARIGEVWPAWPQDFLSIMFKRYLLQLALMFASTVKSFIFYFKWSH